MLNFPSSLFSEEPLHFIIHAIISVIMCIVMKAISMWLDQPSPWDLLSEDDLYANYSENMQRLNSNFWPRLAFKKGMKVMMHLAAIQIAIISYLMIHRMSWITINEELVEYYKTLDYNSRPKIVPVWDSLIFLYFILYMVVLNVLGIVFARHIQQVLERAMDQNLIPIGILRITYNLIPVLLLWFIFTYQMISHSTSNEQKFIEFLKSTSQK